MGIFNELSKDFNGGFNPAGNLGQVVELMNKYSRIRTRTGAFNPIIYNSWHEKSEEKTMPRTVSANEIEAEIDKSTRPQVGFVEMDNPQMLSANNIPTMPNGVVSPNNVVEPVEHETEDIMDM